MSEMWSQAEIDEANASHAQNLLHTPLTYAINDGVITVSIGVETLKLCARHHEYFWDGVSGLDAPCIDVTDSEVFAEEVLLEMHRESEDGSTLVTRMFDEAMKRAVENGCEGIAYE